MTKPTLPNVPVIDGRRFDWDSGHGTAEISSLVRNVVHTRLWEDSCDVGFYIASPRTRVLFVLKNECTDKGMVTCWTYESVGLPSVVTVTIFND